MSLAFTFLIQFKCDDRPTFGHFCVDFRFTLKVIPVFGVCLGFTVFPRITAGPRIRAGPRISAGGTGC
jgi:hypothetical protein